MRLQVSPDSVMWLWDRLMGFRGLLRAISAAVFGECTSWLPDDNFLVCPRPPSMAPPISLGPSPFPRMTVSFRSSVAPTVRLVSVVASLSGYEPLWVVEGRSKKFGGCGSVCMAVSAVRSALLGRRERSSVDMATSTISEPKTGGKRTWERPLRELRGVLEDSEEAEELESEPWEDGAGPPLATEEDKP